MAGQGVERREILRVMALAAAASRFAGFHHWAFACEHVGAHAGQVKPGAYTPQFFTPEEYATVERLTDLIIPSDGSPGAREAGVSEFVDFMVFSDPALQYRFRYGLTWLDAHAEQLHGKSFGDLSVEDQKALADKGALLERCFTTPHTGKVTWETWIENIRATGPESSVLSTDLGQVFNPPVEDGMALMVDRLLDAGFTEEEVYVMAVVNTRIVAGAEAL